MAEVSDCINEQGPEADAKRTRLANRINSRFPAYLIRETKFEPGKNLDFELMDPQPDPWPSLSASYVNNTKSELPPSPYGEPSILPVSPGRYNDFKRMLTNEQ